MSGNKKTPANAPEKPNLLNELPPELKNVLSKLPDQDKIKVVQAFYSQTRIYSSPIPPPDIIDGYEKLIPESGKVILSIAKNQSDHRIEVEKLSITSQNADSKRGQIFAFILAIVCIGAAVYLASIDATTVACLIGGGTLISLVTVFIKSKMYQFSNLQEKIQE